MGLLRTPPQRVQPLAKSPVAGPEANTSLQSPSLAFAPRHPGVVRTPFREANAAAGPSNPKTPAGAHPSGHDDDVEMAAEPTAAHVHEEQHAAEVDEPIDLPAEMVVDEDAAAPTMADIAPTSLAAVPDPISDITPSAGPPNAPDAEAASASAMDIDDKDAAAGPAPATPVAPKTPVSRTRKSLHSERTPAQVLSEPAVPIADPHAQRAEFGRRYQLTMDTLDLAAGAAAAKWTAKDLEDIFPSFAAKNPQGLKDVYLSSSHEMRQRILAGANEILERERAAPALKAIEELVREGKEWATAHPGSRRRDAWRADLTPPALTAATNLPVYDQAYARLRQEYIVLYEECQARSRSIAAKTAELREAEGSVSEGVVGLEQTIKLLDGFPNEEMAGWAENMAGRLEGQRAG